MNVADRINERMPEMITAGYTFNNDVSNNGAVADWSLSGGVQATAQTALEGAGFTTDGDTSTKDYTDDGIVVEITFSGSDATVIRTIS